MPRRLLRKTTSGLAKGFDQVFARTALNPPSIMKRQSAAESLGHEARMSSLATIASFYNRDEFLSLHNAFIPEGKRIAPTIERKRLLGDAGEVLDLCWPSEFEPLLGSVRDKYLGVQANRFGHARWYRHHGAARPCVLLVHGYMSGHYLLEERMWPVQRLFDSGLDVVLPVLPFHGPRRSEARGLRPPAFPSSDPRFTIEGFRQTLLDLRSLCGYLLENSVSELGVMGMSLGGYTAALLATLEDRLRFAVLFVPLASIDDFAFSHGRMVGTAAEQAAQRDALRAAQWAVSPFARPSLLAAEDVIVIAGEADQVTGMAHAERLAEHFSARLEVFSGGHLLHFGKARAFVPVWQLLERRGYMVRGTRGTQGTRGNKVRA